MQTSQVKTGQRIILAAAEQDSVGPLSPTDAALLGWAVTDGTIRRVGNSVRIGISQSKEEHFDEIRSLVGVVADVKEQVSAGRSRTFPSSGRTYDTKRQHWWYLPSAWSRDVLRRASFTDTRDLPCLAARMGHPARRAMLTAFMHAEGDQRGNFYNGDPALLDTLEILCALEGLATRRRTSHLSVSRIRVKKARHVAISEIVVQPDAPAAAWCPTTEFGTWVMRQNGRVMITGNTKAKRRVALSICGLGLLDETEVETLSSGALGTGSAADAATRRCSPGDLFSLWDAQGHASRQALYAYVKTTFGKRVIALTLDELETVRQWIEMARGAAAPAEEASDAA